MTKRAKTLYSDFQPQHYALYLEPDHEKVVFSGKVIIKGRKIGRPSHRITLHQKKLKLKSAKLTLHDKKAAIFTIDRINHLNNIDEVRIHTKEMLYPGSYELELDYLLPELFSTANTLNREIVPSIDEAEAWAAAEVIEVISKP